MTSVFIFGPCAIFGGLIGILAFAFWIWMLVDCLQNPALQGTDRLVWFLVIFFLHFLGALIYYLVGRKKSL